MRFVRITKFAQIEYFLQQKGYSQDLLDAIKKLSPAHKKELGAYLNANPNAKENEVLVFVTNLAKMHDRLPIKQPKTPKQDILKPTDQEIALLNRFSTDEFRNWASKQIVSQRNQAYQKYRNRYQDDATSYSSWLLTNYSVDYRIYGLIYDWYQFAYLPAKEAAKNVRDPLKLQEIAQEYALPDTNIQLKTLSYDDAVDLQEIWHEARKGRHAGRVYQEEKASDIVYGPKWKLKKFNGWTIKKVTTDNNLKVEGNLMDHCVGDYCEKVTSGSSQIFSLRDPRNKPHVTMEVVGNYNFEQVYGPSNSDPKPEYKMAIGEWLRSLPNFSLPNETYHSDFEYDELDDDIKNRFFVNYHDYGIEEKPYHASVDDVYDNIMDTFNKRNKAFRFRDTNDGGPKEDSAAEEFARGVVSTYKNFDFAILQNANTILEAALNYSRTERLYPQLYNIYKKKSEYSLTKVIKHTEYYLNILHDYIDRYKNDPATEKNKLEQSIAISKYVLNDIGEYKFDNFHKYYAAFPLPENYKYSKNQIDEANRIVMTYLNEAASISKYSATDYPELKDLPQRVQEYNISTAINKRNSIGLALLEMQKRNDSAYEERISFEYYESAPNEDDYETTEEYEEALKTYEEQRDVAESEYEAEIQRNLPFSFNNAVYDYLRKFVGDERLQVPTWIVDYYQKAGQQLPESMQFIVDHSRKPTNASNRYSSGWYSLAKYVHNFEVQI